MELGNAFEFGLADGSCFCFRVQAGACEDSSESESAREDRELSLCWRVIEIKMIEWERVTRVDGEERRRHTESCARCFYDLKTKLLLCPSTCFAIQISRDSRYQEVIN